MRLGSVSSPFFIFFFLLIGSCLTQSIVPLPTLREQASIQNQFSNERVNKVLPLLMRQYGARMWIVSQREYGEDNVFWAIKSATQFAARRRTTTVFYDDGFSLTRRDLVDNTDNIWNNLRNLVEQYDPENIVLNIDETFAFSDGLRSGEREAIERALGEKYASRIIRKPYLALDFIATRVDSMIPWYKIMMETVWSVIAKGFSSAVITPGVTTTDDVVWWFREEIRSLGYTTWFQPSVGIFRKGIPSQGFSGVINKGDMIWCDIGFTALGLNTDTQHVGYVLRDNETDVPEGLKNGLRTSNIMQDTLMEELKVGLTGNVILANSRQEMSRRGINGSFYSHPIGDNGHGAGALIGYIDIQEPVPVRGDALVIKNSWFSIELQSIVSVPEWNGQKVEFRQEEDMFIDGQGVNHWVYNRQTEFHLVR